jgi:hypothetical protein
MVDLRLVHNKMILYTDHNWHVNRYEKYCVLDITPCPIPQVQNTKQHINELCL